MKNILVLTMTAFLLWGCASTPSYYKPGPDREIAGCDLIQKGLASWYGNEMARGKRKGQYYFNPTASGERFVPDAVSAAHRTLPFGTYVRVVLDHPKKNSDPNGILVRINDRGPYVDGRIIDLSWGAAKKLGMMNTQPVHIYRCDTY